jgi:hypothetical protein
MVTSILPAEINDRNKQFWMSATAKAERRMADPGILQLALMDIESYSAFLPVYYQKSFEKALRDADLAINHDLITNSIHRRFSHRGGLATKTDALQQIILKIVEKKPSITQPELVEQLRAHQHDGVIDDIGDADISFRTHTGKLKTAPLSGLKDRLSRAKKAIRSR